MANSSDSKIEIILEEPIGTILPDLYGHFTEHIGGVIYDGIWVGENSKIPNIKGIRKDLVEYMRRLNPSVVRWPGGCFADSYNWRDGIGPREQRPRRANYWVNTDFMKKAPDGPEKYEPNHFGTHEFVEFCRLIGAEPYLAANVRSATAEDFYQWVEYCNAPAGSTTLAEQRAANGHKDPHKVRFWGIGNESWGCGGNFTPEEYAMEYSRFATWVPEFGVDLALIGAGPLDNDLNWTRKFFEQLKKGSFRTNQIFNRMYGWALHYYCGTAGEGNSINFSTNDWYELLYKADRMDVLLREHWDAMSEFDPEGKIKLIVDEWGAWHQPGTEVYETHLFGQTSTMRDALIAGLTLDIFNRHADKVVMGNVAQLINNLHSLFLAHEDQFVATPNFHVFEMYSHHYNGTALRMACSAAEIDLKHEGNTVKLWGLAGSASLHGKDLVLTAVNPNTTEVKETEIAVRGAKIESASGTVLAADDIHAHNSFDHPTRVGTTDVFANPAKGKLRFAFPPASVTRLRCKLS